MKKLDDPLEIALTFVNKNNIINLVTSVAFVQRARLIFLFTQKEGDPLFGRGANILNKGYLKHGEFELEKDTLPETGVFLCLRRRRNGLSKKAKVFLLIPFQGYRSP